MKTCMMVFLLCSLCFTVVTIDNVYLITGILLIETAAVHYFRRGFDFTCDTILWFLWLSFSIYQLMQNTANRHSTCLVLFQLIFAIYLIFDKQHKQLKDSH